MAKILVTGGCGYIGSHTLVDLIEHGFGVIALDSNVRSDPRVLKAVEQITGQQVIHECVDLRDQQATAAVFERHDIQGVIHFAALKSVPESTARPLTYYENNLQSLINILYCVERYEVPHFIFSSSCSVYGNTSDLPVVEETPLGEAQSPYAQTKQMCEQIIRDFIKARPEHKSILLRYFNPGGAHPSGQMGEIPQQGAYNVIPIILEAFDGKRPPFVVTGDDHPTPDGSCVRDYIHVMDVAHAHTCALKYLLEGRATAPCTAFNIGLGNGVSVLELIQAFERVTGKRLPYSIGPRRAGDVSSIYANAEKANRHLGWLPKYSIDAVLESSWRWYQNGYRLTE